MFNVLIKYEFELDTVVEDFSSYEFDSNAITKDVLVSIIEKMNPTDYKILGNNGILWNFTKNGGVLDDETIKVLLSGNIKQSQVICCLKLSPEMIDYILPNYLDEIYPLNIIEYQTISTEQLDIIINRMYYGIYEGYSRYLGNSIGISGNIELAKHVVMNWDNYNLSSIGSFREALFEGFSSIVIDPVDEIIIFGFNRPMLCTQDVQDLKPGNSTLKRVLKWTSFDEKIYTWNEFIALHILANQDNMCNAKSDLLWLATVY